MNAIDKFPKIMVQLSRSKPVESSMMVELPHEFHQELLAHNNHYPSLLYFESEFPGWNAGEWVLVFNSRELERLLDLS